MPFKLTSVWLLKKVKVSLQAMYLMLKLCLYQAKASGDIQLAHFIYAYFKTLKSEDAASFVEIHLLINK